VSDLLTRRLALLSQPESAQWLAQSLNGIEKESLRVTPDGHLALTAHPLALGSALTHPYITTDYAEALLEFVTGTHADPAAAIDELRNIHRYVMALLDGELLWNQSMPARLPHEAAIPIGWYGTSNSGMLRHVYRRGLALRYGKAMQCIAGVHFNFSLAPQIWSLLGSNGQEPSDARTRQSEGYMALVRNFSRYSWLLMYLFGASPALSQGFLQGRDHQLQTLRGDTLYLPWATSLRMSDLGYQNKAQAGLRPCYTNLPAYLSNLYHAVNQPWPEYERLGTHQNGDWVQLSTHILQIENEYYATIRPKRVAHRGERPLRALQERGVQYVEVRCIDIDPFDPVGINLDTSLFLNIFLTYCALEESPNLPPDGWCEESGRNFATVVREGRKPGLQLHYHGQALPLADYAERLFEPLARCAATLDAVHGGSRYRDALERQRPKLYQPDLTPSGRLLAELQDSGLTFHEYALHLSEVHANALRAEPLCPDMAARFAAASQSSLDEQTRLEASREMSFDDYVSAYHASLNG